MKTFIRFFAVTMSAGVTAIWGAGGYHLLQTVPLPGEGYVNVLGTVDTVGRRLYVSHNTRVEVMDVDSGKLVGTVEKTPGVRGIALAPELGRGFTTNAQASSSTIFDLKTLGTIGELKVGQAPSHIIYDSLTKRIFTLNRRGYNVTAIDAGEGAVAGSVELDARPEFAVPDAKGRILVSVWEREVVVPIDARKLTAAEPWRPGPCQRPGAMAIDQKNQRLFVGCDNRMIVVLNANNGRLITTVRTGEGRGDAAFDPETRLVLSSNADGTLTVIHQESADKYRVLETIKTAPLARPMALDLKTHRIFFPLADQGPEMGVGGNDVRYVPGTFRVLVFGM